MEKTFTLELTRGELGILLRHVKMDTKNDEVARKFIALAAPEVARDIDEVLDLKNSALKTLIERIKAKAYEVGNKEKIKEYDQILTQHMKSKDLTDNVQKYCQELFKDFIIADENIDAALISREERNAHLKFFDIAERVLK
jgi:hypothetical protein